MSSELEEMRQRLARIEDTLGTVGATLGSMDTEFRGKLDVIVAMLDRLTPPAGAPA